MKIPAKIQYCKSIRAWVFMHEYIQKSTRDDSECPWLLRSEETEVYDIEEVQGPWQVWAGVISNTDGMYFRVPHWNCQTFLLRVLSHSHVFFDNLAVDIVCNQCNDDADCNLNGVCKEDGKCECFDDVEGVQFIGPHCEVLLKDECKTIYGGRFMRGALSYKWFSLFLVLRRVSLP